MVEIRGFVFSKSWMNLVFEVQWKAPILGTPENSWLAEADSNAIAMCIILNVGKTMVHPIYHKYELSEMDNKILHSGKRLHSYWTSPFWVNIHYFYGHV